MTETHAAFGVAPYSGSVLLWFEHAGRRYPVAQAGPRFIIPQGGYTLEPCEGLQVMELDGQRFARPVRLPHGIPAERQRVEIVPLDDAALPF